MTDDDDMTRKNTKRYGSDWWCFFSMKKIAASRVPRPASRAIFSMKKLDAPAPFFL
jgi:predicted ATP-dependent Lon-type protease